MAALGLKHIKRIKGTIPMEEMYLYIGKPTRRKRNNEYRRINLQSHIDRAYIRVLYKRKLLSAGNEIKYQRIKAGLIKLEG